ncbi:hypothetical protein ACWGI8_05810 [Streptomyces sp. NPDC054841]
MTAQPFPSQYPTHAGPCGSASTHPAGQPGPPQHGHVQAGLPSYPAAAPGCRVCGALDIADVTVRAHQGLLVLMRFHKMEGPFCRSCGRAVVRQMTVQTLCLGWFSPLSLVAFTPFTLVWNLIAHRKYSKLPASVPAPGQHSLPEGAPVHQRPLAYVALVPLGWAVWFTHGMVTHYAG